MHDKLFKVKPVYPLALLTLFEFQINLIARRSLYLERNMPLVSLEMNRGRIGSAASEYWFVVSDLKR